ncbi:MAG: multidrug effflux MFS transporter [Gammaproteobacteria bacterium]|nr:multidrug effflux MFS transporter [Gammaproteobacteria bacterium]
MHLSSEASKTTKSQQRKTLLLCMFLSPLIGLGLDLYTPSLPAITSYFHVSSFLSKLTIILYIAGFGLAQPFVGIISDHTKRKSFLLTALTIYLLSSFASAWSQTITELFCYRIINSITTACISVVIKSIIVDTFSGKTLAKANNYYTMSWSLTPMIAPVIGGYLQNYFQWQANFYFMALYAFIGIALCCFFLIAPKKNHIMKENSRLKNSLQNWKVLFSDKIFLAGVFILSVENAILFLYYTAAPFIIQTILHFNAAQYGEIMLFGGFFYVMGNIVNGWLLNYFRIEKLIVAGLIASLIIAIFSIAMLKSLSINQVPSIYMTTVPIFLIFLCDGLVFSNIMTSILSRYSQFSGTASGLLAGLLNLIAALIVSVSAHWFDLHDIMNLNIVYIVLLSASLFVFYFMFFDKLNSKNWRSLK